MIAKLNQGTGFGGLVNYANDIKQKNTNIIASDGVSLSDNKTIAASFKLQAYGNPKVKNNPPILPQYFVTIARLPRMLTPVRFTPL